MIPYPSTLPCVSRIEGHSAALSTGVVRTPMEAGNTRQRRTQRVLPHQLALVFVMPQEIYATWLAWVNAHAFDTFIDLPLPGLLASRVLADTTPTPVRFISDIQSELLPVHRLWYWRCRVQAEWLPMAGDLAPIAAGQWIVAGTPAQPSAPDRILAGRASAPSNAGTVAGGTPQAPAGWI
jgi:hypothetical protein